MDLGILGYDDSRTLNKKRGEILEAAKVLFIDQGIDRVSMQMIAEASSITRRSLYNYYESKEKIAVDIQILNLRKVSFFDTWNILGKPAVEVKEIIKDILENQLQEYMFISCFDIFFSRGYPDKKYVDFMQREISTRTFVSNQDLSRPESVDYSEFATIDMLIAYTQRLVMRIVRESLSFAVVEEEVNLICSLLT
ncbi:TetR/AcrR family transcriptional regulator [Spirochaeta isovalerica]|uniref:AcrR family transcriptional regulator n=1 Tax=Spirochaeta isovalerica TaxID=150 RepID=A0A841RCK8_9SPIO|nr:helix-turn-helix domain-containing protein [Spirochaeta isovalerica]MBB6480967.1 AcrR family transcriptional regulator [Spirochaeta isovalerica]